MKNTPATIKTTWHITLLWLTGIVTIVAPACTAHYLPRLTITPPYSTLPRVHPLCCLIYHYFWIHITLCHRVSGQYGSFSIQQHSWHQPAINPRNHHNLPATHEAATISTITKRHPCPHYHCSG
jgi:hypothetical protein